MIEKSRLETLRIMACPAITVGYRMRGCGSLIDRADTIVPIVAISAGLGYGVDDRVIESTAEVESRETMTHTAIDRG